MSQEIIEGIQLIEKEKGIEEGVLITALEDALRAAYKKTPGATRHAEVKLDDAGEFRVFGIEIPEDIEFRLVEEDRHGPVVDERDLHPGAEDASRHAHALILQRGAEALVQRLGESSSTARTLTPGTRASTAGAISSCSVRSLA